MAYFIVPSSRAWRTQPPASARLDDRQVKYIGVYSGRHGTVNLATGQAMTRGSAVSVAAQKTGLSLKQTAVNAGIWCPAKNISSMNAKYIALWHGVFVGAIVGSSPKLVGVSNSDTSQSTDLIGIERATNDQITVTVKVAGTDASRTFSVSSSSWYGKTVTLLGFYEISTVTVWLYAAVDGVLTKYSSTLSFSGDSAPTIPSTAQFVVGTDVIENPSRSPNVHTSLAACFYGSVHNSWLEDRARNPWGIFAAQRIDTFVPIGGGSTLNASAAGADVASGSAALSAQVALAAVGVSTASGSAALSASVPLSATGVAVSSGGANPTATVTIAAAGLAQAAGQAGLSASVLLAGAGAAQAAGNATLAAQLNALAAGAAQASGSASLSGGAAGSMSASGQAQAGGSAVLSVTIGLQASGSAQSVGSASGSANAPGAVSASGGAVATGAALPVVTVSLTAAGFVQAMGAGQLVVSVNLTALGQAVAAGSANLGQPGAEMTVDPKFLIRGAARNYLIAGAARNYHITRRAS
jgi:hypothetical protein